MTFGGQSLRPKPYWPKSVQANRVHTSEHDVSEAMQTTALALATLPARKSYCWPNPDVAPTAVSSSTGTYVNFVVGDPAGSIVPSADFMFPFMSPKGFPSFQVHICVAAETTERSIPNALMRVYVEKLYGGATTINSVTRRIRPAAESFGLWANNSGDGTRWRFGLFVADITGVTSSEYVAVTRFCSIVPEINWEPPNSLDPYDVAGSGGTAGPAIERTAKIVWARITATPEIESPQ